MYHAVGDMHGPSKATVCRVVRKVAGLINTHLRGAIRWPGTQEERVAESRGFYYMAGVPDVIGEYGLRSTYRPFFRETTGAIEELTW